MNVCQLAWDPAGIFASVGRRDCASEVCQLIDDVHQVFQQRGGETIAARRACRADSGEVDPRLSFSQALRQTAGSYQDQTNY